MVRALAPTKTFHMANKLSAHNEHDKVVYWSSTQSHYNNKQWDILMIKSKHIRNCASQYNLNPNYNLINMSKKTKSQIRFV